MSALVAGRKEERRMRSKWAGQVEKGDLLGHGFVICLDSFCLYFFTFFFLAAVDAACGGFLSIASI